MSAIAEVHVGEPNDDWRRPIETVEDRVQVHFHNFADLLQEKGTYLESPKFTCAGHEWHLELYPRGAHCANNGMISIFLDTDLSSKIVVDYDIIIKKKTGDNFKALSDTKNEFPYPSYKNCDGWLNFVSRNQILRASNNVLNNGTLTIEVRITPHEDYIACRRAITKSSVADDLADDLYRLYQDEGTADVAFKVKTDVFHAHKLILKSRVPELAELVEPYDTDNPIPIKYVEPDIFDTMLKYAYGKDIDTNYWKENAKQLLDASGKYGFSEIKSKAEAWHVINLQQEFTIDNAVDELLYADGKSCPLLKKAAMDFIIDHGEEVIESESYNKLDESPQLRKEVMKAFASRARNASHENDV
eukprot:scaffold39184_cov22-Cyclotella_meneghiniana.AAC.4